jgi:Raf kinase inhibitor-like YbhB/YbcL family protein
MASRRVAACASLVAALASLTGCGLFGDDVTEPARTAPATLALSSPAFEDGGRVPTRFTCKGANVSPPLRWTGVPDDARALALVVTDPDAPGGTYAHWIVFNLPPETGSLAAGELPSAARQARNSAGRPRYDGPCPPSGTHHYRFVVYALRTPTTLGNGAATDRALAAIDGKAIGRGTLVGTVAAT